MAQTAVEWYTDELLGLMLELATNKIAESEYHTKRHKAFEQAKQMEKEQIIEAFDTGCEDEDRIGREYYEETYKNK